MTLPGVGGSLERLPTGPSPPAAGKNIQEGKNCPLGAPVSPGSRDPNKLDVFVVGNDGRIYTAAWDHHVADGKWRGWWKIAP